MAGARSRITRDTSRPHIPVLLNEVMEALSPQDGEIYIDGTFGAGGYTRALLEAADCAVIAIDRDPQAISLGQEMCDEFGDRLMMAQGCFGDMKNLAAAKGVSKVHGVTLDLGVSSMQLDVAERGFSFMQDGPLDMRMGQDSDAAESAAEIVNQMDESKLARIIALYGEERKARAIARAIGRRRGETPLTRTGELAELVERVVGHPRGPKKTHPATRTFQALRIYVNDELGELMRGLAAAEEILHPGGRLAVVTFHSLEDRVVKKYLARRTGRIGRGSRHLPETELPENSFAEIDRRSRKAGDAEIGENPRARSARLRAAMRTMSAMLPADDDLLPRLNINDRGVA